MKNLPEALLEKEAAGMARRYKTTREEAEEILRSAFHARPGLVQKIHQRHASEDVTRWREYRDAVKEARKEIYYSLRRYRRSPEEEKALAAALEAAARERQSIEGIGSIKEGLLRSHVSTRERFPHYPSFYGFLFSRIGPPSAVLDLGCGLHPLSFPFEKLRDGGLYAAVDRQKEVIRILEHYAAFTGSWTLKPSGSDLEDFHPGRLLPEGKDRFDLIFMLKFIPVIERQRRRLLPLLASLPGGAMLVTAGTEALSRREDIRGRENRSLRRFIGLTGRKVRERLELPNEFGYLLI
jgi:16S rRNA (guanine(1405)-N(7))-methyltransferase